MSTPVATSRRKLKLAIKDYADAQVALSRDPSVENNREVLVAYNHINDRIADLESQVRWRTERKLL